MLSAQPSQARRLRARLAGLEATALRPGHRQRRRRSRPDSPGRFQAPPREETSPAPPSSSLSSRTAAPTRRHPPRARPRRAGAAGVGRRHAGRRRVGRPHHWRAGGHGRRRPPPPLPRSTPSSTQALGRASRRCLRSPPLLHAPIRRRRCPRDNRPLRKEHEWIRVEGDARRRQHHRHAQQRLGDIVFVNCPHQDSLAARPRSSKQSRRARLRPGRRRGGREPTALADAPATHNAPGRGLALQDQARQPGRSQRRHG